MHPKENEAGIVSETPHGRPLRMHSGCVSTQRSSTGSSSSSGSGSSHLVSSSQVVNRQQPQSSSENPKNYIIIQSFEPKPRKRL